MTTLDRYAVAQLECDLVMKGGITSGVVYPLAICRLAERYRLRNIGGASAGAIAAVAAGAAEYGRATAAKRKGAGFEGLSALPQKLMDEDAVSKQTRLLSLFQPSETARDLFEILLTVIDKRPGWWKAARTAAIVLQAQPFGAACGMVVAACLVVFAARDAEGPLAVLAMALGAGAAVLAGLLATAASFVWTSLQALGPDANYGLCPGYAKDAVSPPLTQWLTTVLDDLAGVSGESIAPITFGDLAKKEIKVSLMTTDLTRGHPHRVPFSGADASTFFFKESDFQRLFPELVVSRMVAGARARVARTGASQTTALADLHAQVNRGGDGDYFPFPDLDDLPLVVGARMSLSFPLLLQAIPLYAVDWTLKSNQNGSPKLERCWFSDGGICSNLPIHFFDALLPGRPTFALSLKGEHPDYPVQTPPFSPGKSETDNVWIPRNNSAGTAASWNRFDGGAQAVPLLSFLVAIIETMQNWNDNLTIRHPGYRDRIVHISHTADEGGMNLNMGSEVIERLSHRGAAAGDALRNRFDPDAGNGWSNHRWVRYRNLLAMLSDQAASLADELDPSRSATLSQLMPEPPSYPFESRTQEAAAAKVNGLLVQLGTTFGAAKPSLSEGAPNPRSDLRGRPRSS